MPPSPKRTHRRRHQQRGYYLRAGGSCHHRTSAASHGHEFFGPVRVNRAVLPHMRRQRSGVLMHISSGAGAWFFFWGFLCASKFALEALAEAYSYELAAQGIESVIVQPGAYETPVFGNTVKAADEARTKPMVPSRRSPRSSTRHFLHGRQCSGRRRTPFCGSSRLPGREAA